MSKIAEMRQKRGELWDKAKAFLNEHADENGMMNAEDTATYERMEKDIDSFGAATDREGRSIKRLNELYAATGQIGFRVTQRLDARLVQQEGMKCLAMKAGS